jgi:hypothetical protein
MAEARKPQADFIQQQLAFAAHIRDPDNVSGPADVEDRRMAIYRELFYNNVAGFIQSGFPVLHAISDDASWHRRVRAFFRDHHCQTPYFTQIAAEFVEWLENERGEHPDDPPFLRELAHYEWVELALSISDADRHLPAVDPNGDLMDGVPVLSPLAWPLAYQWPVQHIGPEYLPDVPGEQPTYLVVNRDRLDKVHFLEINAVTYRLLQLLSEQAAPTGQEALQQITEELGHPDPAAVIEHGRALLDDLRARNILLGTRV